MSGDYSYYSDYEGDGQDIDGPINADFEADARFVKLMMSVDENYRLELGHRLQTQYSVIERKNKTGFLLSCTFKGRNCDNIK